MVYGTCITCSWTQGCRLYLLWTCRANNLDSSVTFAVKLHQRLWKPSFCMSTVTVLHPHAHQCIQRVPIGRCGEIASCRIHAGSFPTSCTHSCAPWSFSLLQAVSYYQGRKTDSLVCIFQDLPHSLVCRWQRHYQLASPLAQGHLVMTDNAIRSKILDFFQYSQKNINQFCWPIETWSVCFIQ